MYIYIHVFNLLYPLYSVRMLQRYIAGALLCMCLFQGTFSLLLFLDPSMFVMFLDYSAAELFVRGQYAKPFSLIFLYNSLVQSSAVTSGEIEKEVRYIYIFFCRLIFFFVLTVRQDQGKATRRPLLTVNSCNTKVQRTEWFHSNCLSWRQILKLPNPTLVLLNMCCELCKWMWQWNNFINFRYSWILNFSTRKVQMLHGK